jgi:hypothetical protein
MKRAVYISGFFFAALLMGYNVLKIEHLEMPDCYFYFFSASALTFFFLLVFTALRTIKK